MDKAAVPEKRRRGRPRSTFVDEETATVRALDRGIHLLRALATEGKATLTDLSLRVGMSASTAHRPLTTLQKNEMVEFQETTQQWLVGVEAYRVGSAFIQRNNLIEVGLHVLRRLVEDTGETANLAIADKGDVVFLAQIETPNPIRAFFPPGTRAHMHASGIGKMLLAEMGRHEVDVILREKGLPRFTANTLSSSNALLAELDVIRRRGWSLDDEERFAGMRCIAAPIYDAHGKAVTGISISGPAGRFSDARVSEMAVKVKDAAAGKPSDTRPTANSRSGGELRAMGPSARNGERQQR